MRIMRHTAGSMSHRSFVKKRWWKAIQKAVKSVYAHMPRTPNIIKNIMTATASDLKVILPRPFFLSERESSSTMTKAATAAGWLRRKD